MDWIKGYTSYFGTSWKCNKNRDFLTNSGSIEIYGYSLFLSIYRIILTKWNPLFYSVKNDKKSVYLLVRNICRNNRLVYVAIPRKVRLPKDWSERSFFGTIGYFESIEVVVPRCSVKKAFVLRNFAKFTGKHLCQSLFFNKVARNFIKKRLWHRCFPVNFAKFLRTTFLTEHPRWLLLNQIKFNVQIIQKPVNWSTLSKIDWFLNDKNMSKEL